MRCRFNFLVFSLSVLLAGRLVLSSIGVAHEGYMGDEAEDDDLQETDSSASSVKHFGEGFDSLQSQKDFDDWVERGRDKIQDSHTVLGSSIAQDSRLDPDAGPYDPEQDGDAESKIEFGRQLEMSDQSLIDKLTTLETAAADAQYSAAAAVARDETVYESGHPVPSDGIMT
mmetsp:Transcript_14974/g.40966  ORF Transcript_14974/g.40966 Transcript_14974/m.40966 type:complete len:171 (+) Transcript_14974:27-539(+)